MRVVVLILGILGGAAAAYLGWNWYHDYNEWDARLDALDEVTDGTFSGAIDVARASLDTKEPYHKASYILLADAAVGLLGGILAFSRKALPAGLLMVAGAAAPAIFVVDSLAFTSILGLAGLLALIGKSIIEKG